MGESTCLVNTSLSYRRTSSDRLYSAAKAGISIRSGRRIEKGQHQDAKERHWRTRRDPLEAVWETELIPLLEREPSLTGITLWDHLDEQYPGQYPERLLRTLQTLASGERGDFSPVCSSGAPGVI